MPAQILEGFQQVLCGSPLGPRGQGSLHTQLWTKRPLRSLLTQSPISSTSQCDEETEDQREAAP